MYRQGRDEREEAAAKQAKAEAVQTKERYRKMPCFHQEENKPASYDAFRAQADGRRLTQAGASWMKRHEHQKTKHWRILGHVR
jgi:hypothetical protein